MNVPHHELYRIAEEAHKTGDDKYVKELCEEAGYRWHELARNVYRATQQIYNHEFARR